MPGRNLHSTKIEKRHGRSARYVVLRLRAVIPRERRQTEAGQARLGQLPSYGRGGPLPFGNLAILWDEGPMALRPTLTDGLPFRGPRQPSAALDVLLQK